MTIAERARTAAKEHPFILEGLREGVINYTAAARYLDVGDVDAVAAALRRYATELEAAEREQTTDLRLRMVTGVGETDDPGEALLHVGDRSYVPESGSLTAIVATGAIPPWAIGWLRWELAERELTVHASGGDRDGLILLTDRGDGPAVLRIVERLLHPDSRD